MKEYNKSNYKIISKMIYTLYDEYAPQYVPASNLSGVRNDLISDYINFVDDITRIEENLLKSNILTLQDDWNFAKKVLTVSQRYNSIGNDAFINGPEEFFTDMMRKIKSWVMKDGHQTFRLQVEKQCYTKLAFSKEDDTTSNQNHLSSALQTFKNKQNNNNSSF